MQALALQPKFAQDFLEQLSGLASNLHDVQQTCVQAAIQLQKGAANAGLLSGIAGESSNVTVMLAQTAWQAAAV